MYKIAMVQQKVVYSEINDNLERARNWIKQASEIGCVCAVLPECCDMGWANPKANSLAKAIPGDYSQIICQIAREYKIYVVIGLTELEAGKIYNTAILVSDEGKILGKHRKINLLNDVEPMFTQGDRLRVYDTKFGRVGINICADNSNNSTVIGECLGRMGAQIILSPCSWAVRPEEKYINPSYPQQWIKPYTMLAERYNLSILGVSNVGSVAEGPWAGWSCIGSSVSVLNSNGKLQVETMAYGEDKDCINVVEFTPNTEQQYGVKLSASIEENKEK